MKEKPKEIVVQQPEPPAGTLARREEDALSPALSDAEAEKLLATAVRRHQMILAAALGVTNRSDWVLMGSGERAQWYLEEKGAMKVARLFGLEFRNIKVEQIQYSDERGPVIDFAVTLEAVHNGKIHEAEGGRSTKDQFFNRGKDKRLPLSEIPIMNVRKAAVTNAKGRATKKILGLDFTREEVEAAFAKTGKSLGTATAVSFGGEKKTMTSDKEEIWRMLVEVNGTEEEASAHLEELSAWTTKDGTEVKGKRRAVDLTDAQATFLLKIVRPKYKAWQDRQTSGDLTPPTGMEDGVF